MFSTRSRLGVSSLAYLIIARAACRCYHVRPPPLPFFFLLAAVALLWDGRTGCTRRDRINRAD